MKLISQSGKWYIIDKGRVIEFDNSTDAWRYILLMKEIRPLPPSRPTELYPVRSLVPFVGVKKIAYS